MKANSVPHLLVYISGHGFGHVAQTAPVLNRLHELVNFKLTIVSAVPAAHLQSRIHGAFEHIPDAVDFGMKMISALDVQPEASFAAYQDFHRDWPRKIEAEIGRIQSLAPDFVLTNVAYLPLAAARRAGVACAAICSLNWVDILQHYCGDMPGAEAILVQMREAYAAAERFFRVTPGMEMETLSNVESVGPIARIGRNRREEIVRRLGLNLDDQLVLVSMGGIATDSPMADWPLQPGVHWLVPQEWAVPRQDVSTLSELDMDFTDVLASCDAMVCKPGYGSFTEAACNGIAVLYVSRKDWPEEPCLVSWLKQAGRCREISREAFEAGQFQQTLDELLALPIKPAAAPTGIDEAASYLLRSMSIASP
ncbi:conserved hypothetical protein [Ricinus communis]|uniref:Uncharacterized protein n=1 Tax=Ricinus communis TaxID=3988 RepID=B9T9D9_RICCO|nr:conserved hypothetical protein [Ricinus communis]